MADRYIRKVGDNYVISDDIVGGGGADDGPGAAIFGAWQLALILGGVAGGVAFFTEHSLAWSLIGPAVGIAWLVYILLSTNPKNGRPLGTGDRIWVFLGILTFVAAGIGILLVA